MVKLEFLHGMRASCPMCKASYLDLCCLCDRLKNSSYVRGRVESQPNIGKRRDLAYAYKFIV